MIAFLILLVVLMCLLGEGPRPEIRGLLGAGLTRKERDALKLAAARRREGISGMFER